MTQRKKVLGVVLILVIYVVIALAGFFLVFLIKNALNKPGDYAKTPKVTTIPAPSGFVTYQNEKENFSLSYPETLKKKETSYGFGINTIELRSEENTDPAYAPDIQILTVPKSLAKTAGQDFDAYYDMTDGTTSNVSGQLKGDTKAEERFTKVRNRDINGLRAFEYSSVPNPNPEDIEAEIGVFIEKGNDLVIIAGGETEREQLENVLKTFNTSQ